MRFLFGILLVLLSYCVNAQHPLSIHLTENEGLPSLAIYTAVKDKNDFIWLGTNMGLYRYDGNEFKSYFHPDQKGRSIFNLKVASDGKIWCNNVAGQFFYVANDNLILFNSFEKMLYGTLTSYSFLQDKLLFRDQRNLIKLDIKTLKTEIIATNMITPYGMVGVDNSFAYVDDKENLVFFDRNNVSRKISLGNKNVTKPWTKLFAINNHIFTYFRSEINAKTKVIVIDKESSKVMPLKIPELIASSKVQEFIKIDNQYYLTTDKGLFVAELKENKLVINNHWFKTKFTTTIFIDNKKNIWVGTLREGMYVIPNKNLKQYKTDNAIEILQQKNDSISYVVKYNGEVLEWNTKANTSNLLFHNPSRIRALLYQSKRKELYVASDSRRFIYHLDTKKYTFLKNIQVTKSLSAINDTTYLESLHFGTIIIKPTSPKITQRINHIRTYKSIYSKKNKKIYLCDLDGVKVFNKTYQLEKNITFNEKPIHAFDITELKDGSVWVATYHNGLLKIKDNAVSKHLNEQGDLISNKVSKIDSFDNTLIIVTDIGIQFYETKTQQSKFLSKQDGLKSLRIRAISVQDDNIFFASEKGLFGINKTTISKENSIPKPYLNKVFIEGKQVDVRDNYTLTYDKNSIEFNFNVKQFQSVNHIKYQYKLQKKDTWKTIRDGLNFIKFSSLNSGNFNFQFRAKNRFGKSYSKPKSIKIKVIPPFYKRWWFILLIVFFLSTIIYIFLSKTKKEKNLKIKQLKSENQLISLKLESIRSQMNPHFIFNSLNSIQDLILEKETHRSYDTVELFAQLVRHTLSFSKKEMIRIKQEISYLEIYLQLEQLRFEEDFSYQITNTIKENVFIPSLIIQPFVENALLHGLHHKEGKKRLEITFEQNKHLVCTITDNGIGRTEAKVIKDRQKKSYESFSTKAIRERLEILKNQYGAGVGYQYMDLKDENNKSLGTKVVITLPYKEF